MPVAMIAMLVGLGVQVLGPIIGNLLASGDKESARKLMEGARERYNSVDAAKLDRIVAQHVGPSAMNGAVASQDPNLRADQLGSLDALDRVIKGGGESLADRAALNKTLGAGDRSAAANRNAIMNNMHAQGLGGSGIELASQEAHQQDAAQNAHDAALERGGMAQRRALDAIMARGQLAGGIRGQDFGEKSAAAQAQDHIDQFNATTAQNADQFNAQQGNQEWNDNFALTGAKAGADTAYANTLTGNAAATNQAAQGVSNGVSYAAGKVADYDEEEQARKKKNPYLDDTDYAAYSGRGNG